MGEPRFLVDAGPLVAYFHPRDQYHDWARNAFDLGGSPLITCEAVLVEAFFLLAKYPNGFDVFAEFCESGSLETDFRLLDQIRPVRELLKKYSDVPMDLADACRVLLVEEHPEATVITTDSDFRIYRTRGRRQIPLLAPFST